MERKVSAFEVPVGDKFKWEGEVYTVVTDEGDNDTIIVCRDSSPTQRENFNPYYMVEVVNGLGSGTMEEKTTS